MYLIASVAGIAVTFGTAMATFAGRFSYGPELMEKSAGFFLIAGFMLVGSLLPAP